MMCLLFQEVHTGGHGIRPHSLKVTTISTFLTEIAKGIANLPQLAIQGNYRAVAAQDMAKVYSRNLANRQIFVTRLARGALKENRTSDSLATGTPGISEENQIVTKSTNAEILGKKPSGRAIAILKSGEIWTP